MTVKEDSNIQNFQTNITVIHNHHYHQVSSNEEEPIYEKYEAWTDETINLVSSIVYSVISLAVPVMVTAISSQSKNTETKKRKTTKKQLKNN